MGNNWPVVCRPAPEKASGSKLIVYIKVLMSTERRQVNSPLGGIKDLTVMTKESLLSISVQ